MSNRLEKEQSPYLRAHSTNPIDWYPWGEEAFQRAKQEDKLVFLSIGYSTCHWCHVMARESFEDKEVADYLNTQYISIKIDREEYPDVDQCYMTFCQMLTGSGGWPMSIIVTPERKPVFAGTYFPKEGRGEMPGFLEVLSFVEEQWRTKREEMEAFGEKVIRAAGEQRVGRGEEYDSPKVLEVLLEGRDEVYGGFGYRQKFPLWRHLTTILALGGEKEYEHVVRTVRALCSGGIYDHVGGGIHRYTIDRNWHTPHFEKMLYDQAQCVLLIGTLMQKGQKDVGSVAEEIMEYVEERLRQSNGLYGSAEDAESSEGEGRYYTWTDTELKGCLTEEEYQFLVAYGGVKEEGNFYEEATGMPRKENIIDFSTHLEKKGEEIWQIMRRKLRKERSKRAQVKCDHKVVVDGNALYLLGCLSYAVARKDKGKVQKVEAGWERLMTYAEQRGDLVHLVYEEGEVRPAVSTDYAFCIWLSVELFRSTGGKRYWEKAKALMEQWKRDFWVPDGYFAQTKQGTGSLPIRLADIRDGAIPSAQGIGRYLLAVMKELTGEERYSEMYEALVRYTKEEIAGESGRACVSFWWAEQKEKKIRKIQTSHSLSLEQHQKLYDMAEEQGEYWYIMEESLKKEGIGYQYCGEGKCWLPVERIEDLKKE